jgi:hypothetical protein
MKLHIEQWIESIDFSENIKILFKDSIICYKSGANRASLLFSYLAFMTILKERIIGGAKPNLFPQGEWDLIISKLQNEDLWEASIFDSTQQKEKIDQTTKARTKDPVFNINDNLRIQIKYWKDRRNDCAHYKDNIIDTYHVESFWAFIESNLSKITIEGGMQSLLNKIHRHFDPTFTPPNKEITELVKEIESSVESVKMKNFWELLLVDNNWTHELSPSKQKLINKSLEVNSDFVNQSLIEILKSNQNYLNDFLSNQPEEILRFNFSKEEVRKFWKTQLKRCDNILGIYTSFLRNGLIPKNEVTEANKVVINLLREYSPSDIEQQILKSHKFLDAFKSEIIENSNFIGFKSYLWVNEKADIIAGFIEHFPADKDIISKLCVHYASNYNSEWLLNRLDNILVRGNQLTEDYKAIITTENLSIPDSLNKYFA